MMVIQVEELLKFLHHCKNKKIGDFNQVIVPSRSAFHNHEQLFFSPLPDDGQVNLDGYRPTDPLKTLFYMAREQVYPEKNESMKRLIVGAKACDIAALLVMDKALLQSGFVDPVYQRWREQTTLIGSDCTDAAPTCHCTLVHGKPYSEKGFDLNLSRIGDRYFISTGSEKGKELLNLLSQHAPLVEPAKKDQQAVDRARKAMTARVIKQNKKLARSDNYEKLAKSAAEKWRDESLACVGCGACTNICPTCYCLILNDESVSRQFVKVRSYDSCQLHGYARVAGGGSPRPKMQQRFRNRYLCKFLYMHENFDTLGCTGCGRCTDACTALIDFRQVVYNISHAAASRKSR